MPYRTPLLLFIAILFAPLVQIMAQYQLGDSKIPVIEKMTESYKGKNLGLADLDKIVREISQDGLFQIVYVETQGKGIAVIRAQQSTKLKSIQISGNNSFQNSDLIKAMEIEIGEILSDLEITQAIDRIRQMYKDSGYYNFRIRYSKEYQKGEMVLQVSIDEQENCIIHEIQIYSKNSYLNKLFQELILKYKKSPYRQETASQIEKDINDLLLNDRFLTAKVENTSTVFNPEKTKVKLKYTISNATQFEFVFHGNTFFSHFDLIKKSKIGGKFLYLSDSSSEIVDSVRELYLKNGFPQIEIKQREQFFEKLDKKVFLFEIFEGPRIRIGQVDVVGKISQKMSHYVNLFKGYLAKEAHSVYFVEKDVEHAAEEMVTHLKREGHLQAELLSVNYKVTSENTADITIQVDEGILTYVRQILFRGSKSFSNIQLREQIGIEPNKPLNIKQVEASFDKLELYYKNEAYLEFRIKNRNANVIQYKPGQPYADIVYQVDEGPRIKVSDVKVSGNRKTKDYVIIRELDFKPGDYLTLSKLTNSIDRLEKTALFGKVNVRTLEQGTPTIDRTIIVEVEERKPGLFSFGVGLLNDGLLTSRGYIGALYNNIGGKARLVTARVDLKYRDKVYFPENRVALSYYEPFIREDRVRGRVSLVREQQLLEFEEDNSATILSTNDIQFSVEKEFTRHFRFTYNVWGFSNQETFRVNLPPDTEGSNKILNIATTGPVVEFDYRNNQFLPTDGSYHRIEAEYSDPLIGSSRDNPNESGTTTSTSGFVRRTDEQNEINFAKASVSSTLYTPLSNSKRWVWANSVRGGYLKNLSSREDSGIPLVKSFLMGGASTIRGFSIAETIPSKRELCINQGLIDYGQETNQCQFVDVFVRNDSAFFLVKSELRFPISGNFGGLVFYDGGAVFLGNIDLEDPYRDSVGFGFRYDTPVGSFVIQFGYKLDRKLGDLNSKYDKESDISFHLAIGTF